MDLGGGKGGSAGGPKRECRWFAERLGYYLDGELSSRAMARANRHLAECPSCRREVSFLSESLEEVRGLRTVVPGSHFQDAVWEKIAIAQTVTRQRRWWARPVWSRFELSRPAVWAGAGVLGAAAAALLLFVVLPGTGVIPGDELVSDTPPAVSPESPAPTRTPPERRVSPASRDSETDLALDFAPHPGVTPEASWPSEGDGPPLPGGAPGTGLAGAAGTPVASTAMLPSPVYGRLEPSPLEGDLMFDRVRRIRDPWMPERGDYVVRQVVVTRPGEARISF